MCILCKFYGEVDVWLRFWSWCLVEILKMKFDQDTYVFELVIWTQPSGPLCLWQLFVVTVINMLTLGIRRTCIIFRYIWNWFEAVSATAILQLCARRDPKRQLWNQKWPAMTSLPFSQTGLKWSRLIPNGQFNLSLAFWGHFRPIYTFLDLFRPK